MESYDEYAKKARLMTSIHALKASAIEGGPSVTGAGADVGEGKAKSLAAVVDEDVASVTLRGSPMIARKKSKKKKNSKKRKLGKGVSFICPHFFSTHAHAYDTNTPQVKRL